MDISTFRWILVIAGIAIVAGIFLFGNPDRKRKPRASRKRVHAKRVKREPALSSDQYETGEDDDGNDVMQAELAIDLPSADGIRTDASIDRRIEPRLDNKPEKPAPPPPDKIITLFLQARDNHICLLYTSDAADDRPRV